MSEKPTYEELSVQLDVLRSISSLVAADVKSVADHVLMSIVRITGSAYGFYGFINEDESVMTIHSWSGEAMKDCSMMDNSSHFSISEAGVWGEAIRRREPLILNDYGAKHPAKKGLPQGHVQLTNLLVVPFMTQGRITSIAAVANRAADYGRDDVTQLTTFLNSIQTITDGKRAEEALRESEERFRSIIEKTDAGYFFIDTTERKQSEEELKKKTHDLGGRVKELNCLYGISNLIDNPDIALVGIIQGVVDLIPLALQYPEITCSRIFLKDAEYKTENFQSTNWKKSSDIFVYGEQVGTLEVNYLEEKPETDEGPFLKEERNLINAIAMRLGHIIERIQTEEEKLNLQNQLQQAQKMESIGTLTDGIAHDFNNILYIITGNVELALEDIPEWNPVHANLEEIKAASLRAAGIVKQLLNFNRKTDQELKPIGAITVIKDALKFLRSTIPTTIEIRKHLPDTDVTIIADPIQINQVLMNICTNASQAMEETGGILEITVENITLGEEAVDSYPDLTKGEYVKIAISDTGPGIDPEIIDRIFDPYFTTREVGKGSGMGLAVVHGIIKNHSGAVIVDSEIGKGTTVTILFPVVTEKPVMEVKTSDEIPRGNETILVVDDEKSIVAALRQMLGRLGYKVETAITPQDALDRFSGKPEHFDLVITDMTMPQMTGVALSEKLMGIRSDIPIIISTGYSAFVDEEKAKELGLAAYVMKPIVMRDIAKTIRKVLDKK